MTNQYQLENATSKIEGYFIPRPNENNRTKQVDTFHRAKQETIAAYQQMIRDLESVTHEQFLTRASGITNAHGAEIQ